jgi:hypothetical protein
MQNLQIGIRGRTNDCSLPVLLFFLLRRKRHGDRLVECRDSSQGGELKTMAPNEKFFYWEGRKQIVFGGCLVESLFKSSRLATKVFKR